MKNVEYHAYNDRGVLVAEVFPHKGKWRIYWPSRHAVQTHRLLADAKYDVERAYTPHGRQIEWRTLPMREENPERESEWPQVKVTKVGAGYVFVPDTDYRCEDCWKFIPDTQQCMEMRPEDRVKPHGYCIYWSMGKMILDEGEPMGAYTPEELGYGEDPHGTKCRRCIFYGLKGPGYCVRVDENSPGDTPGEIHPEACCAHQSPRD